MILRNNLKQYKIIIVIILRIIWINIIKLYQFLNRMNFKLRHIFIIHRYNFKIKNKNIELLIIIKK